MSIDPRCPGHADLAEEVRQYAVRALNLLEPLVERLREQPADPDRSAPASCATCPVCAVITVLRGGRSELAVRLADRAAELLDVLRAALDEGAGVPVAGGAAPAVRPARPACAPMPSGSRRLRPDRASRVQRIEVSRDGWRGPC
jgi:hypothetical protein